MSDTLTIRPAPEPAAAATLLEWAAAEGWNPGLHDAAAFHAAEPDGWWLAETPEGEPVAGLSLVHDADGAFAFLGLYIVRPDWRGRGAGLRVWTAALAASRAACIGLDGVPAQQANYARSGFAPAFRSQRFRFNGPVETPPAPTDGDALVPLTEVPEADVLALDRAVAFPGRRPAFLRAWCAPSDGAALGLVRDGRLAGWGVIRRCRSGHKVGPLIAPDRAAAHRLLTALRATAGADEGYLDVPHANPEALALAADLGLSPVFETARMYRGPVPEPGLDLGRLYGVTTFELG